MRRQWVVTVLGLAQIGAYGSSYYLPAVLARPIAEDTGWPAAWVAGGLSAGLLVAGLVSPWTGRLIDRHGGRWPMAASALLLAAGAAMVAIAPGLPVYLAAWLVLGFGMGLGLYDATFATLGRLYGLEAQQAIASLTLIGGFANTVSWPLSAAMLHWLGWRGACLGWVAIDLLLLLPGYLLAIPAEMPPAERPAPGRHDAGPTGRVGILITMAAIGTLSSIVSATLSIHLLTMLSASGLTATAAVAVGASLGPAQVVGRLAVIFTRERYHPVWTVLFWTAPMAVGIAVIWLWPALALLALAAYGAGIGIGSIARGTVPLALFGAAGYASLMGRMAFPALLGQAAAPVLGALLIGAFGAHATFGWLGAAAAANVLLTLALIGGTRRRPLA